MVKNKKRKPRKVKPISIVSDEIFIPNHSGMLDAGKVHRTPTDNLDPVNKAYVDSATFWNRAGTTLSPKTDGDDISTSGDVEGASITTDVINSAEGDGVFATADSSVWTLDNVGLNVPDGITSATGFGGGVFRGTANNVYMDDFAGDIFATNLYKGNVGELNVTATPWTLDVGLEITAAGVGLDITGGTSADQLRLGIAGTHYYKMGRNTATGLFDIQGTQSNFTGYNFKSDSGASLVRMNDDGSSDFNEKSRFTAIGGHAIKLTNKTGGNTIAGQLVRASFPAGADTDDAFETVVLNSAEVIGIVLEAGVSDGSEAWVVVSGVANVLMDAGGSARGDRIISSPNTAGSADVWNVGGAVATHFQEIGHCIETRTGAGLARCVLHFN